MNFFHIYMQIQNLIVASSIRHDYGKLYQENGKMYFNLNLQIRFLK